jgi:hypothetical protein
MSYLRVFHRALFYVVIFSIIVLISFAFRNYGYDDPYITFRYARNVIQGNGFVYNVGENVLSTTAPGYALILALIGLVYRNIPSLGNVISAVGLGIGAISFYLWASEMSQPFVGWVAGLFLLTFPLPVTTFGSEMCLYTGMLLLGLYFHARRRFDLAMGVMAILTLIRLDGVIAAGLIAIHLAWTQRHIPWKPILIYLLILLPWLIYATWAFGSPVPVTLSAKQAQGRMIISTSFARRAWSLFLSYVNKPLRWPLLPLGLIGIWRIVTCKRQWSILLVWTACYFASYVILRISAYHWYYAPLVPAAILPTAVGLDWIRSKLACWRLGRFWQWGVMALCSACLLWPNVRGLYAISGRPDTRLATYRRAGQWIDANLPADASVGMVEVGIVGFYAQRRIIGFAALLQPEASRMVSVKTTYEDIAQWAIRTYRPDYVLFADAWFPSVSQSADFTSTYAVHHLFEWPEGGVGPLVLYKRIAET